MRRSALTSVTNEPVVNFRFNQSGARRTFAQVTTAKCRTARLRLFLTMSCDFRTCHPRADYGWIGSDLRRLHEWRVPRPGDSCFAPVRCRHKLTVIEERSIGPGLGADSVEAGRIASIIAGAAVIIFMILAYGRFGIIADLGLDGEYLPDFRRADVLQATLTLPGIAGIVLTIGMAVDANVLIFERIREEARAGRSR